MYAVLAWFIGDLESWLPILAFIGLAATIIVLIAFAINDWRSRQRRGRQRSYRYRRTAHERFASGVAHQRRSTETGDRGQATGDRGQAAGGRRQAIDNDELLRQLLDQ